MSKVKDFLAEHGLAIHKSLPATASFNVNDLKRVYPDVHTYTSWNNAKPEWGYIEKCCKSASHGIHCLGAAGWGYSWPGQGYIVSKVLLPIDILHQLLKLKESELAEARKRRFETIKSARDAVRVTFRDLKIKHTLVSGSPRVDCGPVELEFAGDVDSPKVEVSFAYRGTGYGGYLSHETIVELTVADPTFNSKVQALINNSKNLKKLVLGEVQPENVNKAGL